MNLLPMITMMKCGKKTSKLFISSFFCLLVSLSFIFLSSCNQVWAHKSPIATGAISKNNPNNPYFEFNGNKYFDADGKDMMTYLPSNYTFSFDKKKSYAYFQPIKNWYQQNKLPIDKWTKGKFGWYETTAKDFESSFQNKQKETLTCYQNDNLLKNTSFINDVVYHLNIFINNALNYQANQINNDNKKNLLASWGGMSSLLKNLSLNFGNKTDQDNDKFIEFIFAHSNAHAVGKTNAYLSLTNLNFNFKTFPFISFVKKAENDWDLSLPAKKLLFGSSAKENSSFASQVEVDFPFLCSHSQEFQETNGSKYKLYTFSSVPVIIHFDNLTFRYTSPKIESFLPANFYVNNKTIVQNAIGQMWQKNMPKFTNKQSSDCLPKYSSFKLQTPKPTNAIKITPKKTEPRLKDVDLRGNDFICLMTYKIKVYNQKPSNDSQISGSFGKVENLFPAYFLMLFDDLFKEINLQEGKYLFDNEKISQHNSELLNLICHLNHDGQTVHANDLSQNNKDLLSLLGFLFSNEHEEVNINEWMNTKEFV